MTQAGLVLFMTPDEAHYVVYDRRAVFCSFSSIKAPRDQTNYNHMKHFLQDN